MNGGKKADLILNVDDDEIGRYTKTRILRQAGFDVMEAGNGTDALNAVRMFRPQLVLLDLQLPDMDGFEVCRQIRADPASVRLPVLHITATARAHEETEATSLESGADIFLAQPVEPQELLTVVRTLLRLRSAELFLVESEERMRLATEGAGIATWDIDMRDGSAHFSKQLFRLLGMEPSSAPVTWEMWRRRIHPDDQIAVMKASDRARRTGELFNQEHRIVRADDSTERWLAPYGRTHGDVGGEATRFIGVVVDITARKRAEAYRDELLRVEHAARREAENLARLKDEFLATLSHELRSPMSAILGWLHLMRTGRLNAAQQTQAVETIERNAQLQNQLINDLLDISTVIAGKLELQRGQVLMTELVDRAVQSVRLSADAKQVGVSASVEPTGPLYYDASRMHQVFVNLLSNAIKFTPSGRRVHVTGVRHGERYAVTIRDEGEGIAPEVLPLLFERFRQADGSTTRRHGGLGLGLAIVRHLVELHGGTVAGSSEGLGQGATFTVDLPMTPVPANDGTPPGMRDEAPAVPRSGHRLLAGLRVLITDDEASARSLMSQVLASEGAQVRTAESGQSAFRVCSDWKPDVVILDIGMPDEDGYDLLKRMRGEEGCIGSDVPAVAVTGFAHESDRSRALQAGFAAHVVKPYDVDRMVRLIAQVAGRSRNA